MPIAKLIGGSVPSVRETLKVQFIEALFESVQMANGSLQLPLRKPSQTFPKRAVVFANLRLDC